MKIMVKGESDPARALHRIADYISENYPEGTVLRGPLVPILTFIIVGSI